MDGMQKLTKSTLRYDIIYCMTYQFQNRLGHSVVVVHAVVARVHEEGDGLFQGVLQRSRPPAHILNENHHRVPQRSLVSHSILAFHSVPTSI